MNRNRCCAAGVVLVAVIGLLWILPGSSVWAGLTDMGSMLTGGTPDLSSMLMEKLGIKAPDASGLMEKGNTVTGEVADPAKLSEKGMKANAGDKLELTNLGGDLGVKNLLSGDMLKLDWKSLLGTAAKFMIK